MITKEPLSPANPAYNHAFGEATQVLIRIDGQPALQLYGMLAKLEIYRGVSPRRNFCRGGATSRHNDWQLDAVRHS